ncbi:MAG TPA: dual specificity protein phosphatase [Nitrospiraceae bacterium]
MHQITDKLFVGNIYDAGQPVAQISALLLVAEEFVIDAPPGLLFERIPFKEYGDASATTLARAVEWVERHVHDNRVMVCCRAGMGRSISVVMAYLCCVKEMDYADVLKLVKTRRPGAMPLPKLEEVIQEVRRLRSAPMPSTDTHGG